MSESHALGQRAEVQVGKYYQERGYRVLARNFRAHRYEIDLVVTGHNRLVFVEVKARKELGWGEDWSSRWREKKRRIQSAARVFLARNPAFLEEIDEIALDIVFVTQGRVARRIEEACFR